MTLQETLILAAKAAEIVGKYEEWNPSPTECNWGIKRKGCGVYWNSFTSNDDCFRLETALVIDVIWWEDRVVSWFDEYKYVQEFFKDHNGDRDKARRYASTRAAALRGRE